jgi:alpha-1,3-rhamnosyl/mannosyltransferase
MREPVVLVVGVVAPQKNLDTAIDIFIRAFPRLPMGSRMVLVGHDDSEHWRRKLAPRVHAAALDGVISYLGPVSDERLSALYRMSRALLFVSRGEGFGLPTVEAFAHGLPVVATPTVAAAAEAPFAGTSGADIEALADAVVTLLTDEANWGRSSRQGLATPARTWGDVAQEHLGVYGGERPNRSPEKRPTAASR